MARSRIDGAGTPVEWAVEMARFDENAHPRPPRRPRRDRRRACRRARPRGRGRACPGAGRADAEPWIAAIGGYIDEHDAAFRAAPDLFPPDAVAALTAGDARSAYARIRPLLQARGERGLIRRCHGDLHLGNIVLIDGEPVLFDAIEFSEIIASGDVLYDLAFLLMDLHARGLDEAANIVFNRYLIETHRDADLDGLAALPFFLSMRAAIRAKVTAARLERGTAEGARRDRRRSAPLFRSRARAHRAAAAEADRRRRPVRHRQVGARARAGAADSAGAGRGAAALRCRAQAHVRQGRDRAAAGRGLHAGGLGKALCAAHRARRARRRAPAIRRSSMRCSPSPRSATRLPHRGEQRRRRAARAVPHRRPWRCAVAARRRARGDASDADAKVVALQQDYDIGALDWTRGRCLRHAGETLRRARAALESRPPMKTSARHWAVGLAGFCSFLNLYSPQAILPLLGDEFHAGAAEISAIMTAGTLSVALIAPFTGTVADVLGRKRVIVIAMALVVVPTIHAGAGADAARRDLLEVRAGAGAAADLRRHHRLCRRGVAAARRPPRQPASTPSGASLGGISARFVTGVLADLVGWRAAFLVLAARHAGQRHRRCRDAAARAEIRALGRARRLRLADAAAFLQSATCRHLCGRLRHAVQFHSHLHLYQLPAGGAALRPVGDARSARSSWSIWSAPC